MVEILGTYATQIEEDGKHMQYLQGVARKQKDVIKLTCVNDKLVELKAERNVFDQRRQQFDAELVKSADAARPLYVELTQSSERIKHLRGDADACIGVPELYKQESDVEVTHPDFPDDPTTEDPFEPDVEPPGYASPY